MFCSFTQQSAMRAAKRALIHVAVLAALLTVAVAAAPPSDVCAGTQLSSSAAPKITDGLVRHSGDGQTFVFFSIPSTWCQAELYCRALSGHLASVLTSAENELVQDTCFNELSQNDPQGGCWIGLNDLKKPYTSGYNNGVWQWTDGQPFYYTGWYTGSDFPQPDGYKRTEREDCVFVFKAYAGEWSAAIRC